MTEASVDARRRRRAKRRWSASDFKQGLPFVLSEITSFNQTGTDPNGKVNSAYVSIETNVNNAAHTVATTPVAIVAGQIMTKTILLKANGRTKGQLYFSTNGGGANRSGVSFDLVAKTVTPFNSGAGANAAGSCYELVNNPGWFLITVTGQQNGGDVTSAFVIRHADAAGTLSYIGDGVSGFLVS